MYACSQVKLEVGTQRVHSDSSTLVSRHSRLPAYQAAAHTLYMPALCLVAGAFTFEGREWEVVTEAAKHMISTMLVMDIKARASAKELMTHRWFSVASTAPAAALGQHMVKRLRAFAGMSRMKRLALVVLARTLTDNDVKRLRVSVAG